MKIYGIGTDIVKVSRIKNSLKKSSFLSRIYNRSEVVKCKRVKNSFNCFAKRFAAKEAFSKALGTGIAKGINGKPYIKLLKDTNINVVKKIKKKKFKISLSLTDEDNYAVAFVTISI